MDKAGMLEAMISHYSGGNKARFAALIGVKPQNVNMWLTRGTFDAELLFRKCEGISGDWLLSGEGKMLAADRAGTDKEGEVVRLCQDLVRLYEEKSDIIDQLTGLLK